MNNTAQQMAATASPWKLFNDTAGLKDGDRVIFGWKDKPLDLSCSGRFTGASFWVEYNGKYVQWRADPPDYYMLEPVHPSLYADTSKPKTESKFEKWMKGYGFCLKGTRSETEWATGIAKESFEAGQIAGPDDKPEKTLEGFLETGCHDGDDFYTFKDSKGGVGLFSGGIGVMFRAIKAYLEK